MQRLEFFKLWNSMTPVAGISSIMFHGYNDDLGTLDDVINGVGKIGSVPSEFFQW